VKFSPHARFNPFQGNYCFETKGSVENAALKKRFNPFQGNYCFETPAVPML